jgi:hypothetical protein
MVYLIGIFSFLLSISSLEGRTVRSGSIKTLSNSLRRLSSGPASPFPLNLDNSNLSPDLAGLVEGDGIIKVPNKIRSEKGKNLYPSVTIVFADKYFPLAKVLANKLKGTVNKAQGNYYVLSIYSLSALHAFSQLVNAVRSLPPPLSGRRRSGRVRSLPRYATGPSLAPYRTGGVGSDSPVPPYRRG